MYRRIKGTKDILPDEVGQWQYIEKFISERLERNNYREIRTPIFEMTELFARGVGADTDVVSKEMYTFTDKSHNSLTLRPELTAPVVRAFIQNNLSQINPVTKVYYIGSLFRQERPQKGRLRQFNQFGFEIIGSEHPEADAEVIQTVYDIYAQLGINDLVVRINSIGSRDSREQYLEVLRFALKPYIRDFCPTCQERMDKNILRLFDCKVENCHKILDKHAPSIIDHLDIEDAQHFEEVISLLDAAYVPYKIDNKLVRGLDYYTRTTFEITSSLLGAQDAICGGGRYDYLVEDLGGTPTPAVGVASGMERLLLILNELQAFPPQETNLIYMVVIGNIARQVAFNITTTLRSRGFTVEVDFLRRSLKAQMRDAGRKGAKWVIIIGENEINNNKILLKNMSTGEQSEILLSSAVDQIEAVIEG
ncbi:MAG TPA: histidine--tRNA ligase [Candidatus Marinimicrobia bacterium]|nr:histidine--tRNA ligase [Candidatus Neomarinimicrobiota bacterium]